MKNTIKIVAAQAMNTPATSIFIAIFIAIFSIFMPLTASAKDNLADVTVKDAWVRTSVQGQKATGAFMTLTAKTDLQLVGASSPVAGLAEVHEMKMNGDIMQMRAIPSLALPAGKSVALTSGAFHLMFFDLKAALPKNTTVPLTLVFKDSKGVTSKLDLTLPVSVVPPAGAASDAQNQHKH